MQSELMTTEILPSEEELDEAIIATYALPDVGTFLQREEQQARSIRRRQALINKLNREHKFLTDLEKMQAELDRQLDPITIGWADTGEKAFGVPAAYYRQPVSVIGKGTTLILPPKQLERRVPFPASMRYKTPIVTHRIHRGSRIPYSVTTFKNPSFRKIKKKPPKITATPRTRTIRGRKRRGRARRELFG